VALTVWALNAAGLRPRAIAITLSMRALPAGLERQIVAWRDSNHRGARFVSRLATAPHAVRDATSIVLGLIHDRELGILGAVAHWAFDIAALWASLHAADRREGSVGGH